MFSNWFSGHAREQYCASSHKQRIDQVGHSLVAVQTFFRYVAGREPALAAACTPVLAIPAKKALRPLLGYLTEQELAHLLAQVDRLDKHGERDCVLLSILYDTGARIQELLDLAPVDFHLEAPVFAGKGAGNVYALCFRNPPGLFASSCLPRGAIIVINGHSCGMGTVTDSVGTVLDTSC